MHVGGWMSVMLQLHAVDEIEASKDIPYSPCPKTIKGPVRLRYVLSSTQ